MFLWRAIYIVLGRRPYVDVFDLFHRGYKQGCGINNSLLLVRGLSICWSIWLIRNEVVFDEWLPKTFFQVQSHTVYDVRGSYSCVMATKNLFTKFAGS